MAATRVDGVVTNSLQDMLNRKATLRHFTN